MAYYGIEESIGRRSISSYVKAKFGHGHALACLIYTISSYAPKCKMYIFLIFEEVIQFLANNSSLLFQHDSQPIRVNTKLLKDSIDKKKLQKTCQQNNFQTAIFTGFVKFPINCSIIVIMCSIYNNR